MICMKVLIQGIISSVFSFYAPQTGLDDRQKDEFCDSLINVARKLGEKEIVVIVEDVNGHIVSNPEDYEGPHGYRVKNNEGDTILEFCAAKNVAIGNTFLKKRESPLVSFEFGLSKI